MASVALSSKAVGSIVKIKVNGTLRDFIVVQQGKPSSIYDESCNGTWLLMKDLYESRQWHSSNVNDYANSTIHKWLNNEFLNLIDANIRAQIRQAKIPYRPGSGTSMSVNSGANGLSAKIFLLSNIEVGGQTDWSYMPHDGARLAYFEYGTGTSANNKRLAYLNGSAAHWWLRSPNASYSYYAWSVNSNGNSNSTSGCSNSYGIRPALILPSSLLVSDDGSVNTNTAPTTPASIDVPSTIQGGSTITISWGASTDKESNLEGYILERSTDGGKSWSQIYQGNSRSTTNTVPFGTGSVTYRVKAYDSDGLSSGYKTSAQVTVKNNTAPAIICGSPSGSDLGEKDAGFMVSYSISDVDGDEVTVTEAIDGVTKRTYTATLDGSNSFNVTGEYFMKLLNGNHTLTITANDGKASTVHTLVFAKKVTGASITLETPMAADDQISICVLSVIGLIPADAEYKVEVTNNANDETPVWEDCTTAVKTGANYVFENKTAANGFAFNFRLTAERGPGGEGGYITSVQGGFQ